MDLEYKLLKRPWINVEGIRYELVCLSSGGLLHYYRTWSSPQDIAITLKGQELARINFQTRITLLQYANRLFVKHIFVTDGRISHCNRWTWISHICQKNKNKTSNLQSMSFIFFIITYCITENWPKLLLNIKIQYIHYTNTEEAQQTMSKYNTLNFLQPDKKSF